MSYQKIVTLYDTAQHAEAARRNLEDAGFPPADISVVNASIPGGAKLYDPGIWQRLFGRDIQSYEVILYSRAMAAGGVILTIRVPERDVARAANILNAHDGVSRVRRFPAEPAGNRLGGAAANREGGVPYKEDATVTVRMLRDRIIRQQAEAEKLPREAASKKH